MKIILLVGIFSLPFINISAEKTIKLRTIGSERGCTFSGLKIGPNETVSVQINPEDEDGNKIMYYIECFCCVRYPQIIIIIY
jgi:hypothetical protein